MTHKPSDQLRESLSALVDNETSELELRRILKHIGADEAMREQWRRYHIIGSAMRRERDVSSAGGLAQSVMAAIAEDQTAVSAPEIEPSNTTSAKVPQTQQSWKNWIGKSAVAASFAAVMVLGFNVMDSGSPLVDQPVVAEAAMDQSMGLGANQQVVASAPLGFDIPVPGSRTVASGFNGAAQSGDARTRVVNQTNDDLTDPATQAFLNYLLIEHVERASVNGNLGMLPFARVSKMTESN